MQPLPGTLCRAPFIVSPVVEVNGTATPVKKSSKFVELWAKGRLRIG